MSTEANKTKEGQALLNQLDQLISGLSDNTTRIVSASYRISDDGHKDEYSKELASKGVETPAKLSLFQELGLRLNKLAQIEHELQKGANNLERLV